MDKSTENLPATQAAGVPKSLSLERIRADHEIQCRVNIDEVTVEDYQRDIQAGCPDLRTEGGGDANR